MDWDFATELGLTSPHHEPRFSQAMQWVLEQDARARVIEQLDCGHRQAAERTLLAAGHFMAHAAEGNPERVLPITHFRERFWRRVGFPRSRILRVCTASARCSLALDALKGSSEKLMATRREVWSVCFGQSLLHALHLEQVIRDHDVLILGETGTGKELVAHAIQAGTMGGDDGSTAPAAAINAAAVPETLVESELFGHVRGAFTGALDARTGRLRSAHRGSFFLDEVGDLSPTTQVALLRVMETNVVSPLGSDKTTQADIRYVAATQQNLAHKVEAGSFREDLYQRLAGNVVRLPPLRERPEDVVAIGEAFVSRNVPESTPALDRDRLAEWLQRSATSNRPWPGNVRQLQNDLRDLILGLEPRSVEAIPTPATMGGHSFLVAPREGLSQGSGSLPSEIAQGRAALDAVTLWYLQLVLDRHNGSISKTARVLGVDRTTVYRWLKSPKA